MNDLEIAKKYGVPTPETSKKLDWQGETMFYWGKKENSKEFIFLVKNEINFNGLLGFDVFFIAPQIKHLNKYKKNDFVDIIKAPQMHEIAALLPEIEITDKTFYIKGDALFFEPIGDNYFAEALTKLYIKYRTNGGKVLCTEAYTSTDNILFEKCISWSLHCSVTYQSINDYSVEIYRNYKNETIFFTDGHLTRQKAIEAALQFLQDFESKEINEA